MIITWFGIILSLVSILLTVVGIRRVSKQNRYLNRRLKRLSNKVIENELNDTPSDLDLQTSLYNTSVDSLFKIGFYPLTKFFVVEIYTDFNSRGRYMVYNDNSKMCNSTDKFEVATKFLDISLAHEAISFYKEQHYKIGAVYVENVEEYNTKINQQ